MFLFLNLKISYATDIPPFTGKVSMGYRPTSCLMFHKKGRTGKYREYVGYQNNLTDPEERPGLYRWPETLNSNDQFATMEPIYFDGRNYQSGFCTSDTPNLTKTKMELRMLREAGIDTIFFDATGNAFHSSYGSTPKDNNYSFYTVEKPFDVLLEAWNSLSKKIPRPKLIPWAAVPDPSLRNDVDRTASLTATFFLKKYQNLNYKDAFYVEDGQNKPLFALRDMDTLEKKSIHTTSTRGGYVHLSQDWDVRFLWAKNKITTPTTMLSYGKDSSLIWKHTHTASAGWEFLLNDSANPTQANITASINMGSPEQSIPRNNGLTLVDEFRKLQSLLKTYSNIKNLAYWSWNYTGAVPHTCKNDQGETIRNSECHQAEFFDYADEFDLEQSRSLEPNVYTGHYYYALLSASLKALRNGDDLDAFHKTLSEEKPLSPQGKIVKTYTATDTQFFYIEGWACLKGSEQPAILEVSVIDNTSASPTETTIIPKRRLRSSEVFQVRKNMTHNYKKDYNEAFDKCRISNIPDTPFNHKKMWGFRFKFTPGWGLGGKKILVRAITPYHRYHLPINNSRKELPNVVDVELQQSRLFPFAGRICENVNQATDPYCLCKKSATYSFNSVTKKCSADGKSWKLGQ